MKKANSIFVTALILLTLGLFGCTSDIPTGFTITEGVANNPGVIYGKVVDKQTRAGISGATVMLKVNGSWITTTTAASSGSGVTNTAGDFSVSGLPINSEFPLVVKGPQGSSYLQMVNSAYIYSPASYGTPNNQVSLDLGKLDMEQGVTATIYVVDSASGAAINKTGGLAIYAGLAGSVSVLDVMATQDATVLNKYTIVVPQSGATTLTIPAADINGDGKYDYQSATNTINTTGGVTTGQGALTTTVALSAITSSTTLALVTDNIKTVGANSGGSTLNLIGKNDPITFFFNMPVQVVTSGTGTSNTGARMTYTDNFQVLAATAVTAEVLLTASQSADNTVVTFTPSAALTEVQTYTTDFDSVTLTSKAATGADTVYSLSAMTGNPAIRVYATGAGSIGSTPAVTVDNYNHCTNGGAIVAGEPLVCTGGGTTGFGPYLLFPEQVWGTVAGVSYTGAGTTTNLYASPVALTGQGGNTCYSVKLASNDANPGGNGCTAWNRIGPVYFYILTPAGIPTMVDSITGTPSLVKLDINAYDAEGNTYTAIQTFSVE